MSTFAFYQKVVALNSDQHRNLKFAAKWCNPRAAVIHMDDPVLSTSGSV